MARNFNGTSDIISCGTPTGLNGATKASFSAWIYRSTPGGKVGLGGIAGPTTGTNRFSLLWNTDGAIYVQAEGASATSLGSFFPPFGTGYHHLAAVYDGTQSTNATRLVVYADGVAQTLTFTGTIPSALGSVGPWAYGKDSSNRFDGSTSPAVSAIAEVGLWVGTALNANQVNALYWSFPFRIGVLPTLYHPLFGLGSSEPDMSGNGNTGTLTGTAFANGPPTTTYTRKSRTVATVSSVASPRLTLLGVG